MVEAATPSAILTRGLTRHFGSIAAVDRVDLTVAQGSAVALFGPNGAGKTTLIRLLTLGLRAQGGSIRIAGIDPAVDPTGIRRRIGFISHATYLYDQLTAAENLAFFARLYGVEDPLGRSAELLATIGLGHRAADPVGTLSRGMQQRVSIARALVHDPPVVLLDEPFTGLDPHAAAMLRTTLEGLKSRQRTVLFATHNLRLGLAIADRWVLLARGRILEQGASAETRPEPFERAYLRRLDGAGGRA